METSAWLDEDKLIDVAQVRLEAWASGVRLIAPDRCYLTVRAVRAFPLSEASRYFVLLDGANQEIGVIRNPRELDAESRRLLDRMIHEHYFIPVIKRIRLLREEFGVSRWVVETDRGEREFFVREPRDNVFSLGEGRVMVVDADGNRYDIPDAAELDPASLHRLERYL